MRCPLLVAAVLTASIDQAAAQTGTAEGVVALARGDYQQAADILKPIAEGWGAPDPMAQFFMATMYETGQGVPQNLLRACALYQRASGPSDNPFSAQAMKLHKALFRAHGVEWFQDCQILGTVGFDHRFEPVNLTLTPGHSIAWDLKGATITYQGKSKHVPMPLGTRGTVFFPVRQTDLASGDPGTPYRYFNEVFLWRPSEDRRSWDLEWHLFEVVRDQLIRIDVTSGPVARLQFAEPPDWRFFDVRAYVDVRRAPDGRAEWVVLQGPRAGRGIIESRSR